MDDRHNPYGDVRAEGIEVRLDRRMRVASLRHLDRSGEFARRCRAAIGIGLPEPLHAVSVPGAPLGHECILAWRQPTQTLLLCTDGDAFAALLSALPPAPDGCCVDQSGGLWVLRAGGARVQDLLVRIGSIAAIPKAGEAHVSRVAELAVLTLSVRPEETLLLIDRAYAEHLLNWIRATVADFAALAAH